MAPVTAALVTPPLPVVFTRADALHAGWSRHQVSGRCASGAWRRLAPGVSCQRDVWEAAGPDERTRLTAVATWLRWPGTVLSHTSAAALWGLPLPPVRWVSGEAPLHQRTWLTAPRRRGGAHRDDEDLAVLVATLPPGDVEVRRSPTYGRDLAVTSRARTVADCLRHLPVAAAVALADAAGATGTSRAAVAEVLERQASWPGARRAVAALQLVDPRRESWLESVSAVGLVHRGVPAPEPQVEVLTPGGRFVARLDAWWADRALAGEADGWAKYLRGGAATPLDAERALRTEKRREDDVRALGAGFVRWSSGDVMTPRRMDLTADAVALALRRSEPARLTAVVRSTPLPPGW